MKTFLLVSLMFVLMYTNLFPQWNQQFSGTGSDIQQIYFIDENIGFILGSSGTFRKTTNGGTSWSPVNLPNTQNDNFISINFINNLIGWVLIYHDVYTIKIYKTTDGGIAWNAITPPSMRSNPNLKQIYFISESEGFVVSESVLRYTNNAGANWTYYNVPMLPLGHYALVQSIVMFDSYTGYTVAWDAEKHGLAWGIYGGIIMITGDGGVTWNTIKNSNLTFQKIKFNGTLGMAIGHDFAESKILKTTDKGLNWSDINLNIEEISGCQDISFISSEIIFLAGYDKSNKGVVAKSTDGGDNWTYKHFDQILNSVHFVNEKKGWAAGRTGFLINYIKPEILSVSPIAGTIWKALSKYTVNWSSINVQGNVAIKLSTNGGSTFPLTLNDNTANDNSEEITVPFNKSTSCRIRIESFDDPNIFGLNDGNFTITDPVGINGFTNSQPTEFALYQNFPNPFNPVTRIYYSVPSESRVTIKLYNMLGEEISIMVDEIRTVGNYWIDLDGSKLQSGVYIYQMESEGFRMSKKLMLLK